MPETFRDIYDNKLQLFHQVGTSHHFHIWCTVTQTSDPICFSFRVSVSASKTTSHDEQLALVINSTSHDSKSSSLSSWRFIGQKDVSTIVVGMKNQFQFQYKRSCGHILLYIKQLTVVFLTLQHTSISFGIQVVWIPDLSYFLIAVC
jgi:hypothetical protein